MTDPLDDLLAQMPSPDASESEIESFMAKVMATPGGPELIKDFARKITAGGSLDTMLKEEKAQLEALSLKSPDRFIFRIELTGTNPLIWRRLSLPVDASYFHLHCALQDAFGWQDSRLHHFEVWEDGQHELTFSLSGDDDYCEVGNHIADLFRENVTGFRYLYQNWLHRIVIEDVVPAGEKETSTDFTPHLHDGSGHGPPENCDGLPGFKKFLNGTHPLCQNYTPEVLEEFLSGTPDLSKISFRQASDVLRKKR